MAFDPSRLLVILQNTGLQNKDFPLYQLLSALIQSLQTNTTSINEINSAITNIITGAVTNIYNQQFNTNESFEEIYFSVTPPVAEDIDSTWSVLTNGNSINPELIYAGGDVVMVHTP